MQLEIFDLLVQIDTLNIYKGNKNIITLNNSVEFSSNSINYVSVLGGIVGTNQTYANISGCLLECGNNIKLQAVNSSNDPGANVFIGGFVGRNQSDSVCNNNSVHYGDNISIICDSSNNCNIGGNIGYNAADDLLTLFDDESQDIIIKGFIEGFNEWGIEQIKIIVFKSE